MPSMSMGASRREPAGRRKGPEATPGLPEVGYHGPIVATMLITLFLLLVVGGFALLTGAGALSQLTADTPGPNRWWITTVCGVSSLVALAGVVFLLVVLFRLARDLRTPMYYARGTVLDKRTIGGRNVGNWLAMRVRYLGPDLREASEITQEQRDASPDRTQVFEPRYRPVAPPPPQPAIATTSPYLPSERIRAAITGESASGPQAEKEADPGLPRVIFRVDPGSFSELSNGEEVLVAHSRYLQRIYYVAHLRGGQWESFKNKQIL